MSPSSTYLTPAVEKEIRRRIPWAFPVLLEAPLAVWAMQVSLWHWTRADGYLGPKLRADVHDWCSVNEVSYDLAVLQAWRDGIENAEIRFLSETDAILFKLRWVG